MRAGEACRCKSCGAPLPSAYNPRCEYCGTAHVEFTEMVHGSNIVSFPIYSAMTTVAFDHRRM
jgi:ABC-type ATPase with predicted acetyltransferase domain